MLGSRVLGSAETDDAFRRAGVGVYSAIVRRLTGVAVTDTSSGLRAMRSEVTATVRLEQPQYQSSELLLGAIYQGYRIAERPTVPHQRAAGQDQEGPQPHVRPALRPRRGPHLVARAALAARRRRAAARAPARRRRRPAGLSVARGAARASDRLLELLAVAFAAWTVIYHVCLLAGVHSLWAAVAEALAIVPCAYVAVRGRDGAAAAEPGDAAPPRRGRLLGAVTLVAAAAAALVFGLDDTTWTPVWILWLIAAGAAVAATLGAGAAPREAERPGAGGLVALAWAAGLAALSLFVVNADSDDAQYVHVAGWVAAHGQFPIKDTIFSHQTLPSLFYPPISSFEALLGTLARGLPMTLPTFAHEFVTPLASALSVLAIWRLLRAWGVVLVGLALSVALVFLLLDAGEHWLPGSYFIGRLWQGKVVLVAVLIPILLVLLQEYSERTSRRGLLLLGAAGAAATGLSTTAIFTVPVLAGAALLPLARRRPGAALAGLAAAAAYPLGAGVVTLALGGRNPDEYTDAELLPAFLAHHGLGFGWYGAIALFAALAGAIAIPRRPAARMLAVITLVVGLLYTQGVPDLLFHATGLGRVLWRMLWLIPVAPLLGALAVSPRPAARAVVRALPAVAALRRARAHGPAAVEELGAGHRRRPSRAQAQAPPLVDARSVLSHTRDGDVVLAAAGLSQTLLIISGRVTTVSPRPFYTRALAGVPAMHAAARLRLQRFAELGPGSEPVPLRAPTCARSGSTSPASDAGSGARGRSCGGWAGRRSCSTTTPPASRPARSVASDPWTRTSPTRSRPRGSRPSRPRSRPSRPTRAARWPTACARRARGAISRRTPSTTTPRTPRRTSRRASSGCASCGATRSSSSRAPAWGSSASACG